jgi:PHP family Zn ribbon phosphoesterase
MSAQKKLITHVLVHCLACTKKFAIKIDEEKTIITCQKCGKSESRGRHLQFSDLSIHDRLHPKYEEDNYNQPYGESIAR